MTVVTSLQIRRSAPNVIQVTLRNIMCRIFRYILSELQYNSSLVFKTVVKD